MSQATHWKSREEVRSVKLIPNFKDIIGRIKNIFKNMSPVEGAHHQTLYTTNRSGASEGSSQIQQLQHERDTCDSLSQVGSGNTKMPEVQSVLLECKFQKKEE